MAVRHQDRTAELDAYVNAALARIVGELASAGAGGRNDAANKAAYEAGRLVAAPDSPLSRGDAERALLDAARATGLPEREAVYHVRRGLDQGERKPADLSHVGRDDDHGRRRPRTTTRRPPAPSPAPRRETPPEPAPRPPRAEVAAVWSAARPVCDDGEAAEWLHSRGLNPAAVEDLDLVRVITPDAALPRWATYKGRPWLSLGVRLVARAWDASGEPVSLHARAMLGDGPKGAWPAAGPGSAAGLVLACPLGVRLLRGERFWYGPGETPDTGGGDAAAWRWWSLERGAIIVAEGLPDWLTAATLWSEASEDAPIALGVESGSATPELAARIPDGARVVLAPDPDAAGEKYAQKWRGLLAHRCDVRQRRQRS